MESVNSTVNKTVNNAMYSASHAIWGETHPEHMQHGNEPRSGIQGRGSVGDPYDAGNRDSNSPLPFPQSIFSTIYGTFISNINKKKTSGPRHPQPTRRDHYTPTLRRPRTNRSRELRERRVATWCGLSSHQNIAVRIQPVTTDAAGPRS